MLLNVVKISYLSAECSDQDCDSSMKLSRGDPFGMRDPAD